MITTEDIVGLTDLTKDEIDAVAEHERVSGVAAAAALADYLMHVHHGPQIVQQMICEDIRDALHRDDVAHARELYATLHHFMREHPEAARGVAPV